MRHVFVSGPHEFALVAAAAPALQTPTDAVVKVSVTTICGSDAHYVEGRAPLEFGFPLGHECVGVITEVGAGVLNFRVGDRVAVPAAPWCGTCRTCRRGKPQHCPRGGVFGSGTTYGGLGGAQADYLRVPWADASLSHVPDSVTDAQALTVGDVLSTGWTAVRHAVTAPGQTLVVFGAGPVGLSAIHSARLEGVSRVIAIDPIAERLDLARTLGADHVVDAAQEDVAAVVAEITGGAGAEAVVDAAGVPASIGAWGRVTAVGSRVAMVGIPSRPVELDFAQLLVRSTSVWTGLGELNRMDALLTLIAEDKLDPSPIFSDVVPFDDIEKALDDFVARRPGLVKPLIVVDPDLAVL